MAPGGIESYPVDNAGPPHGLGQTSLPLGPSSWGYGKGRWEPSAKIILLNLPAYVTPMVLPWNATKVGEGSHG